MSEFAFCLMMAAIHTQLTRLFAEANWNDLDAIEDGLIIKMAEFPADELREARNLADRMIRAVEEHGEVKVRRAHGTMPAA